MPAFRFASRCILVEFSDPPVSMSLSEYMELVEIWKKSGSCAALCIKLGHLFFSNGVKEVDNMIKPLLLDNINN